METDRASGGGRRAGLRLLPVPAVLTGRVRAVGLGLKDKEITFSRLRAVELGGMGILAERDCRVDIVAAVEQQVATTAA